MTKFFHQFCLLLVVFLTISETNGQEPLSWRIKSEHGLPSMTVFDLVQDQQGFVWMGTENGLFRYDGQVYKEYGVDILHDKTILLLQKGPQETIWFYNLKGALYYLQGEVVQEFKFPNSSKMDVVIDFHIIDQYLWVNMSNKEGEVQLNRYELNDQFEIISAKEGKGEKGISRTFYRIKNAIYQRDKKDNCYRLSFQEDFEKKLLTRDIFLADLRIFTDHFSGTEADVITLLEAFKKGYRFPGFPKGESIHTLNIFDKYIVACCSFGLLTYSIEDDFKIKLKSKEHGNVFSTSIMNDEEGNLWFGTYGKGVYIIPVLRGSRVRHLDLPDEEDLLLTHCVYVDTIANLVMWGHGKSYVSTWDLDTHKIKTKKLESSFRINKIVKYKEGVYILVVERGLLFIDKDFNIKKHIAHLASIKDVLVTKNFDIYAALSRSAGIIPREKIESNSLIDAVRKHILYVRTHTIIQDYNEKIWIGSSLGLYYCEQDSSKHFIHEDGSNDINRISEMALTKDSLLLVGTHGKGLMGIKNDKLIFHWDDSDKLISNICRTLYVDEQNQLWIGTDKGIQMINLNTGSEKIIDESDGLSTNEIKSIKVHDGKVWSATNNGLITFDVNQIKKNTEAPPIYITGLKIWEKDTTLHNSYELAYNQNNIKIEYVGLAYRAKNKLKYEYRMKGLNENWIETRTNFVRFPNLDAGEYTFEISAINEDGVKSTSPDSIVFVINKPYWEKLWFILLCAFLFLSVIGSIAYVWRKNRKRKRQIENQIIELRMQALQAQMNPHFIFNSLSAIQSYMVFSDEKSALTYLVRFSRLIRMIFDFSDRKEISLQEELEFLKLYLVMEELRFNDKVKTNFSISSALEDHSEIIKLPPLLIQPIIENAFKHGLMHKGKGGKLLVSFEKEGTFLRCIIEDNGVGRAKTLSLNKINDQKSRSSGLKTTQKRIEISNFGKTNTHNHNSLLIKDLFDAQNKPCGTRVEIRINI